MYNDFSLAMITVAFYPIEKKIHWFYLRSFFAAIFFTILFQLLVLGASAQQVKTIGDPGLNKFTLYNTYGPMRSVPGAFAAGSISNRHAYIFPAASLGGIEAQSKIDSLSFYKVNNGALQGTVNLKLYLKNTSATDFGAASLSWETEKATTSLVYDANPFSPISGNEGYKKFLFNSSFLYTGGNLELLVEYSQTTPTTDYLSWAWDNLTVSYANNSVKFDYALSTTPPATLVSAANIHPVMQLFYTLPPVAPLKLISFSVAAANNGLQLKWTTAEESNVLDFTIEKSTDGVVFKPVGAIGAKNSAAGSQYEFTDAQKPAAKQYYRLQIREKDGKVQYSKTIFAVDNSKSSFLKIRPNPAKNLLEVQLPAGTNEYASLLVVDAAGKIYAEKIVRIESNITNTSFEIAHLPGGMYGLLLLERDGHKSYQKFVKM